MRKCIECDHLDLVLNEHPCNICDKETLSEYKNDTDTDTDDKPSLDRAITDTVLQEGDEPLTDRQIELALSTGFYYGITKKDTDTDADTDTDTDTDTDADTTALRLELADAAMEYVEALSPHQQWFYRKKMAEIAKQIKGE